jgi:hypothetical protein
MPPKPTLGAKNTKKDTGGYSKEIVVGGWTLCHRDTILIALTLYWCCGEHTV